MAKLKKHIALISMSLALLSLLLHGMVPHHHHDVEADRCNMEMHATGLSSALDISCTDVSCEMCSDKSAESTKEHACTMNASASKQLSVALAIVVGFVTFQDERNEEDVRFPLYSEPFCTCVFSEVRSLRAPPVA